MICLFSSVTRMQDEENAVDNGVYGFQGTFHNVSRSYYEFNENYELNHRRVKWIHS